MFTRFSLIITCLLFPLVVSAQVVFTEVMYDLETGGDAGREWVEVQNTGSQSIDISGYRLREGTTNHTLSVYQGNALLSPLGVAIISDNPSKFLVDNPNFSGTIFDSSFSLSNTSETLVLKDSALLDIDQFSYSSEMGAGGDGNSLQKINNSWSPALPTPGTVTSSVGSTTGDVGNSSVNSTFSVATSSVETQTQSVPVSASSYRWLPPPQIYAYAGEDKKVTVGTPAEFDGQALGTEKKPLEGARYLWSFGDGGMAEGKRVLHTYRYPGVYMAVLDVSSAEFSSADKLVVSVSSAELAMVSGKDSGSYIEIANNGRDEVDVSYWQLASALATYILPKGTILLPNQKVRFPEDITKLPYDEGAELRYPNGSVALKSSSLGNNSPLPKSLVPSVGEKQNTTQKSVPENVSKEFVSASVSNILPEISRPSEDEPAEGQKTDYKWLYALAGLLGSVIIIVLWIGAPRENIEIIEDET